MRFSLAALAVLMTSQGALAECPTPEDMTAGIRFTTTDGAVEIHKRTRPDWVQILVTFPEGEAHLMEFNKGIYMLSSVPVEGGIPVLSELEAFATIQSIQEWRRPAPSAVWENGRPDGGTAQSGPMREMSFGDCTYAVFDVTLRFADDPAYSETYRYFPDLGTGLLVVSDDGQFEERYTYSGISKVTP